MAIGVSPNEIKVVQAGAKASSWNRNLIFIAVVSFFLIISYMAKLGNVALMVAEYTIGSLLIFSFMFKLFTGENIFKIIHFHMVRERKWK